MRQERKDEFVKLWLEIQEEAKKLTEAGYGSIHFVKGKDEEYAES